jgi:hypothetical protein
MGLSYELLILIYIMRNHRLSARVFQRISLSKADVSANHQSAILAHGQKTDKEILS